MASTISAGTTSGTAIAIAGDTSGALALQTNNGTTAVTIDTSQNVGVGTTNPSAQGKFVVKTSGTGSTAGFSVQASANDSFLSLYNTGSAFDIQATYNSTGSYQPITFTTNGSERMRIDTSGSVIIGTNASLNSGVLTLLFNGQSANGVVLKTSYASTGSTYITFRNSAGNEAGYITQNGTTTVNYVTSSDYRLKENVAPMVGALTKIAQLKPVTYTWKNTNNEVGEGFIAHELQEICPLAVSGEKDAINEDGSIKSQGIDTSKLVALLTASIQELNAKVEAQAVTIAALQAKVGA